MKLQNLTVIFIIIILPIILLVSLYINTGLRTIRYQALYDTGLITSTQDAIQAFEINTLKNNYSDNAEMKRSIIKSSIKMFETSLCDTCNISSYNVDEIEEYIPAIVFGMSDGFYMYAPSYNPTTKRYEHSLKNYVYYSEMLDEDKAIVIRYYLDSYVHVSGYFGGKYESQEGYLINTSATEFNRTSNLTELENFYSTYKEKIDKGEAPIGSITYYGTSIDIADELAVNYFVDNYKFSYWFNNTVLKTSAIKDKHEYLVVSGSNDPEDPNSEFVQHKNKVIKEKIEGVLNSSITAYSKRTWGQNYKMPKLSEEDWQKIYSDISVTTFFQGKKIGFTKYNGYCVLNSNNHYELINPNLLYFSTDDGGKDSGINVADGAIDTSYDYYHDIRCEVIKNTTSMKVTQRDRSDITTIRGWRIGRFQKKTKDDGSYNYERAECACYECINGSISNGTSLYDYIKVAGHSGTAKDFIKESYWTSLARERGKLHEDKTIPSNFTIEKFTQVPGTVNYIKDNPITVINGSNVGYKIIVTNHADKREKITVTDNVYNSSDFIQIDEIEIYLKKTDGSSKTLDYIKVDLNSGYTEELDKGEILEIYYKARIKDNDGNNQVTNQVKADNNLGISVPDEETCNTVNSNIFLEKTIVGDKKTVLYGKEELTYEITIRNDSSITDNIDIKDAYFKEEINVIKIESDSSKISTTADGTKHGDVVNDVGIQVGNISKNWTDITIQPGEEINIYITAKLTGKIGKEVVNTVMVKSNLTGDEKWDSKSAGCFVEKEVKVAVNTEAGKDIFLVLDTSNSMDRYIYKKYDSDGSISNSGVGEGDYPEAVRKFIKKVEERLDSSKITGVILFNNDAKVVTKEDILTNNKAWKTGLGTHYGDAFNKVVDEIGHNNTLIFFSDGNPTKLFSKEGISAWWGIPYGDGDPWPDVMLDRKEMIEKKGTTIYTVGYGDEGEAGLKAIASDEKNYYKAGSISTMFDDVFDDIFAKMDLPQSYESNNGKIEVKYVNRIKDIKVGGISLSGFDSYIIDKNETNPENVTGTLDLTRIINLTGDEEITIFYE